MGTTTNPAQLTAKIDAAKKSAERAQKDAVKAAAELAKKTIVKRLQAAVGSDQRMSNVGSGGAKLDVKYRVSGETASVTASGPWPLIESDTPAHVIGAATRLVQRQGPVLPGQKLRRGKVKGRALLMPDGKWRTGVKHPGTKGKQPFRKGVAESIEPAGKLMTATVVDAVNNAFN